MTLPIDRDAVLAAFREDPAHPLKVKDVSSFLGLGADDRRAIRTMVRALVEEGDLVAVTGKRFALPQGGESVIGRVQLSSRGYGWFIRDDDQPDAFLPPDEVSGSVDGDRVTARISPAARGPVGKIVKVLTRGRQLVTGTLVRRGRAAWVDAPPEVIGSSIVVEEDGTTDRPADGSVVEVLIKRFPTHGTSATGRIVRVIGRAGELSVEIDRLIADSRVPRDFSPETLAEAGALPAAPTAADHKGREDLRSLPLCTIDGETAKDFDDAVHARREGVETVVTVAIADVSHYVKPSAALDEDAQLRGTSVYYPGAVIPMLPESLSNGLCSLRPDVERLCMCAELRVRDDGSVRKTRFFEGVMRSHARLTYTTAARFLSGERAVRDEIPPKVQKSLTALDTVARALRKRRSARGAMDFDLPEEVVSLDDKGAPTNVRPLERNDAHRLIEDLMIAANEAVAERFHRRELPGVYRVHEPPNEEKVQRFLELARVLAKDLGQKPRAPGRGVPDARAIREILQPLHTSPLRRALDFLLLRAMMQARYSAENVGHYSLASTGYTHFTSPIRRYPDLAVHRLLKAHIRSPRHKPDDVERERQQQLLEDMAADASEKERRATDLERKVRALHTSWVVRDRIGDKFVGNVSGCAQFGVFVRVEDPFVEGMIHVAKLSDEFLEYDELRMRLTGRSGFSVGVGDEVEVKLEGIDTGRRQITFSLERITAQHGKPCDVIPPTRRPTRSLPTRAQILRGQSDKGRGKKGGSGTDRGSKKRTSGRKRRHK
jgi:ribonuclease R